MLSMKFIVDNIELIREKIATKKVALDLDGLMQNIQALKELQQKADSLKFERNTKSKMIGEYKRAKKDVGPVMDAMKELSQSIKELDAEMSKLDEAIQAVCQWIPNLPHDSVPLGKSEDDNVEIRKWGELPEFDFEQIKPHWELGEAHDMIDLKAGVKISAAGFPVFKGAGARLTRALLNFMIDFHVDKHGYTEVWPPYLVNRNTLFGTGQLPKLEEDMYHCGQEDMFLIPTAEVPLTNIHKNEIMTCELPLKYTAWTPCFRREAGSYGKDTRGIIRVHQFDKVEMVKFVKPEDSYDELELLLQNAEDILQALKLPYRVLSLCTADLSFAAAKCYDLEVYAAGVGKYLEVSSCSNFEDFQARRAGIRFRRSAEQKPEYVHTLNGSGLALPRTIIAIMENYQQEDGSIRVPEVLVPYMGTELIR